jgi:hypothetical protein
VLLLSNPGLVTQSKETKENLRRPHNLIVQQKKSGADGVFRYETDDREEEKGG